MNFTSVLPQNQKIEGKQSIENEVQYYLLAQIILTETIQGQSSSRINKQKSPNSRN